MVAALWVFDFKAEIQGMQNLVDQVAIMISF